MRIDELTGYKDKPEYHGAKKYAGDLAGKDPNVYDSGYWKALTKGRNEFSDLLKEKGFQRVGAGAYGIVFLHPQLDYAIKVFNNDPCYLKFVKFAQANPSNPHLPKFRGKLMRVTDEMLAVRMEKLSPAKGNEFLACASYYAGMVERDPDLDLEYFLSWVENRVSRTVIEYYEQDPSLLNTLKQLNEIKGKDAMFDLHEGNFMMRGNTYVIIDPFASRL